MSVSPIPSLFRWGGAFPAGLIEIDVLRAVRLFDTIERHAFAPVQGEWFRSIRADGTVNREEDKAGFWKRPYRNSRMCPEAMACAKAAKP